MTRVIGSASLRSKVKFERSINCVIRCMSMTLVCRCSTRIAGRVACLVSVGHLVIVGVVVCESMSVTARSLVLADRRRLRRLSVGADY